MLRADVLHSQPLGFFRGHIQNPFALRAQRHFDRSRNALAYRDARFDLFANGFDRALLTQEAVRQCFILAHQAQEQMLGLDVRASVLARFVACKENYAARFFSVPFKHVSSFLPRRPLDGPAYQGPCSQALPLCEFAKHRVPSRGFGRIVPPASGCAWR